ncbi:small integral membrane protein 24 [Pleurodeles waltl]
MASSYPILMALVLLASAEAQQANRATGTTRVLQPWLVGLTAVVVFLFIVFVLMIVNRLWCKKKRHEDPISSRLAVNPYDNPAMDLGEDGERKELSSLNEDKHKKTTEKVKWQKEENAEEGEKITSM